MSTANIVFPHQLFECNPLLQAEGAIYLIEEWLFFQQYAFHQQKIAFHRATMKYYEAYLQQKGLQVNYIASSEDVSDIRLLIPQLHKKGIHRICIIDPVDNWLLKRIKLACKKCTIDLDILDSPQFLNTQNDLIEFFNPAKQKYFQTDFYKQSRIRLNILVDEQQQPIGGQWSFDTDNRKKYPKGKTAPPVIYPANNDFYREAKKYTAQNFEMNFGCISSQIQYPIGFEESKLWLTQFLQYRFKEFGIYEDAILQHELLLNHSLLTPMLNVGMLTPQQVLKASLEHAAKQDIPINSLEGFIRQIIGWREFIRGIYITKGTTERTRNYWGFTRKIPQSFYNGTTGILPVDITIKRVLETGYCHHIERLMVLGNFMLLCEFDPDEVYRWFMEMFIDAYDWVMVPNVYGMSQFADGGLMSTKPYISGSNYIMKMSDYPKGEWQTIWDALFWHFMDKQRAFFLKNPRLGMLIKTYDKWEDAKKESTKKVAQDFLNKMG